MRQAEIDRRAAVPHWVDAAALAMAMSACTAAWCVTGMVAASRAEREGYATSTLKTLTTAEAEFRSNDLDGNLVNDFWTADVYGLYGYGTGIGLIEPDSALADARSRRGAYPSVAPIGEGAPSRGYWLLAFAAQDDGDGARPFCNGVDGLRDRSRFAFITFPDGLGSSRLAFVINADNTIWKYCLPATFTASVRAMSSDRDSTSTLRIGTPAFDDASVFPASPGSLGCSKSD